MPDNKQVSNLLKKKNQSAPTKNRTLGCPDFIPTQGYRRMLVTNEAIDTRILIELTQ